MTIEEKIVEFKEKAEYWYNEEDFLPAGIVGDTSIYDPIISPMKNATTREELAKAYKDYAIFGLSNGWSDSTIITGIIRNASKNKEFNVDIDAVIRSYLLNFSTNNSIDLGADKKKQDTKQVPKSEQPKKEEPKKEESKKENADKNVTANDKASITTDNGINPEVQQAAPAHLETGFNINSFIKHEQPTIQMPILNPANANMQPVANVAPKPDMLLPHQTCGLSNDDIIAYNGKHYENLSEGISSWALYDLLKSDLLSNKMKELNAKDRPNNPKLKQVPITECTDEPNLIERYPLAFTMQCNDKGYVIVVLFNPNVELDRNNKPVYPIYISKGKLIKPDKQDGEKKK